MFDLTKKLADAEGHDWHWETGSEYGRHRVDQYDRREGGRSRHSSLDLPNVLPSATVAENVATLLNKVYLEGVRRGRAEILKSLDTRYAEYLSEGGVFNVIEFLNDYAERDQL